MLRRNQIDRILMTQCENVILTDHVSAVPAIRTNWAHVSDVQRVFRSRRVDVFALNNATVDLDVSTAVSRLYDQISINC